MQQGDCPPRRRVLPVWPRWSEEPAEWVESEWGAQWARRALSEPTSEPAVWWMRLHPAAVPEASLLSGVQMVGLPEPSQRVGPEPLSQWAWWVLPEWKQRLVV